MLKTLKILTLAILGYTTSLRVHAGVINEITEGCTAGAAVSALCITLSPVYTTITSITVPYELTHGEEKSKIIYQAQSDAATFVASQGKNKGVYLERAFNLLRQKTTYRQADELALAEAILAYKE